MEKHKMASERLFSGTSVFLIFYMIKKPPRPPYKEGENQTRKNENTTT
jgi:hypothetical protein